MGTAVRTISSTAEAKLSGRGASTTPAQAAGKVAAWCSAMRPASSASTQWRIGAMALQRGSSLGTDTLHHAVYAGASGVAYDYL